MSPEKRERLCREQENYLSEKLNPNWRFKYGSELPEFGDHTPIILHNVQLLCNISSQEEVDSDELSYGSVNAKTKYNFDEDYEKICGVKGSFENNEGESRTTIIVGFENGIEPVVLDNRLIPDDFYVYKDGDYVAEVYVTAGSHKIAIKDAYDDCQYFQFDTQPGDFWGLFIRGIGKSPIFKNFSK